ncbi:hypothetical protein [Leptothoe spongobia]|uniref:hypothetical protein n=1 Tax=Leptothoe spongobia TaxID=2651728 RepID=UPI001C027A26|nr:hypothetical protein [Leptothoe spongobia]
MNVADTPSLSELASWLQHKGWQELPPSAAVLNYCDRIWQKKTDRLFFSLYNYNSLQLGHSNSQEEPNSFAIELAAQSNDGYWARYEKYGIRGSELQDVLDDQMVKLLKAWQAIN